MLYIQNWWQKQDDEIYGADVWRHTEMTRGGKEDRRKPCLGRRNYQKIYSFESWVTTVVVVAAICMSAGGTGYSFPPLSFEDYYIVLDVIVGFALWFLLRLLRALNESFCVWCIIFIEAQKMSWRTTCTCTNISKRQIVFYQSSFSRRRRLVSVWGNDFHLCLRTYLGSGEKKTSRWPLIFALSYASWVRVRSGKKYCAPYDVLSSLYFESWLECGRCNCLGGICVVENPWHGNNFRWFDSRLLVAESCRYIQNELVVYPCPSRGREIGKQRRFAKRWRVRGWYFEFFEVKRNRQKDKDKCFSRELKWKIWQS